MIGAGDPSIEGYAAQFTLNHGETVDFKINTDSTNYRIDIYRLGYYGGDGARRVATIDRSLTAAQVQPLPMFNPDTRLVDAGNWSVSASWSIPEDAVSGVYFAKLTRLDGSGGSNMIPFIVRDDEAPSDITFQTSDTTWQAYNWWGGYNLYGGIDAGGHAGRASAVSYNRPIITRDGGFSAGPQDYIFGAEYAAIRFLEQNGYDVNYISGIDTASTAAQLLNSQIFLSVGHDEYWSAEQRDNVEAARDAGVNLSFWSGNEVYWEIRWEASIDGSGTPYKTMVAYKERWDNADTDPLGTTSTWRDPVFGSGRPENALTGTIFTVDSYRLDAIDVPYEMSQLRFWSNTAVADLQPGQVYTLTQNLLGYEWDSDLDNGFRPAGLVPLSSTTLDVNTLLLDYGNSVGPGTSSHSLTLYRAPSGALVFGAGTVYWSWGLDSHHDNEPTPTDPNVQQAMINLFAEMGVQPATLMQSLVVAAQSSDHVAPTSTITSPTTTGSLEAAQTVTITGTATDADGIVAVVEVSTDAGATWHRATGTTNWSYVWTPLVGGNYTIMTRAVDDSINLETPGAGVTVTVDQGGSGNLFAPSDLPATPYDSDSNPVTLGVSFSAAESGSIVGLRYYKGVGNAGQHVGSLWTSTGTLLATATFTNETASGWQTVIFDTPVSIVAGATYVASYFGTLGYAVTADYFTTPHSRGALTATNGWFTYASQNAFPTTASAGSNYWVDVIYSGVPTPNEAPTGNNDDGYLLLRNTPMTFTAAALLANDIDPNNDPLMLLGAGAASQGSVSFDAQAQTITFTPNAGYTGAASFGYSISDGRGGISSAFVNMEVVSQLSSSSLFSAGDTPATPSNSDTQPVNLGVKFVAATDGMITGVRYYRSAADPGTHTGSLWSSTGALLATGTFVNETASGWQTLIFANPIPITAGTTYVASYHSNGNYASSANYFVTDRVNGVLTAPAAGNGVFTYGSGNLFPTGTYNGANYWVDVVMASTAAGPANQAPIAANDSGYSTGQGMPLQIAAAALLLNDTDPDGDPLSISGVSGASNGAVSFDAQTNIVTFTPDAGYTGAAGFSYSVTDGRGGTATAGVSLSVTAQAQGSGLFAANATPATISVNDGNSVELGMQFTVASNGTITGMRFYKGPQNTGVHTGTLWTATGTPLGTVTFTNETATGWQSASFSSPISVTAGASYVISYHTSAGYYSASSGYFNVAASNGALTAPQSAVNNGNGLFAYGAGSVFPTGTYNATNYWVDVYYQPDANLAPIANDDAGFTTQRNAPLQIAATALLANDTDSNGDTLSVTGVGAAAHGSVAFDQVTGLITFTPAADYQGGAGFTYTVSDGRGGSASANVALTVTAPVVTSTLFAADFTPATVTVNDGNAVELGMKFTSSQAGTISGIRFYKGPQNTGPHTGTLWSATGVNLGTLTFTNETASGWQTATFQTPIAITADTTYIVSYHTNGYYSASAGGFNSAITSGPLTGLSSASGGGNGVFAYGSASAFPTGSYNATNYAVDVIFNTQLAS
ncbi:MAG: Mo-co oxidoreductase dimerization domain protein [Pelagibacterium sp. SCN 64-44]|nr:MAG: Mo-co oxidoreductase dimerization domain protein [Pelagibacterium sp. SCN 64-44]